MPKKLESNGVEYVPLRYAASEIDLSQDYMARLCKKGVFDARRQRNAWYVNMGSVRAYLQVQQELQGTRRQNLAQQRLREYQERAGARAHHVFAASMAATAEHPVVSAISDVHSTVQKALEKKKEAVFSTLSASGRVPGVLQAAADLPMRSLAHMPTHFISPTIELLHRAVALMSAFVLVFGAYSIVDPVFARTVADSGRAALVSATSGSSTVLSAMVEGSQAASLAVAQFARDPQGSFDAVGEHTHAVYASVRGQASTHYAALLKSHMTAGAALAQSQAAAVLTPPDHRAIDQVAAVGVSQTSDVPPVSTVGLAEPVALSVAFSGSEVSYGDIISFDASTGRYTLSLTSNDADVYGIAARDPALLFKPDGTGTDIAVTRSGPALVNVTIENGPISAGDALTSSSIPGKARRANDGEHVIATAAEPFAGGGVTLVAPDGTSVESGTIRASVRAGAGSSSSASTAAPCTSLRCRLSSLLDPEVVRTLVRYLLSGTIAALTITLAFKSFMSDANYGVISMGRNPRAKSSIQSLVLFNAVLALVIASAGLFASLIVLFAG